MGRQPQHPVTILSSRPAPVTPVPIPQSEMSLGRRIIHQLTCSWGRKIVLGAFPFIAYFSVTYSDYVRSKYNYQLQQASFFKESVACMANSPKVKAEYGRQLKLQKATIWTVASGFLPWIKERHVWLGFSGEGRDGWIRMGLRRTDFVLDKEVFKAIAANIEQELGMALTGKTDDNVVSDDSQDSTVNLTEEVAKSSEEVAKSSEEVPKSSEAVPKSSDCEEVTVGRTPTENLAIRAKQMDDKAVRDSQSADKLAKKVAELKRLYPNLPEGFSQNDLEQAKERKKDRELQGRIFDQTWDLLSLSIHPSDPSEGDVLVLYDPDDSYVDQGDYLIDTTLFSIKKPESMRSVVQRLET